MNKLRIAILHIQIKSGDTACNRKLLDVAISIAAGYGVQLVVTGEVIESGEAFWRNIYLASIPGATYPYLVSLEEIASKYKMNILFGRAYRNTDTGQIFSTYTHINDEGQVQAVYRKQVTESPEEANYLTVGKELVVTNIAGLDVGLVLGYNEAVQTIINRYEEEDVDLIIGGIAPLRHPCCATNINTADVDVPLILANYNLVRNRRVIQGESLAITSDNVLKFCPICSEVIILDYWVDCEKIEVVNRVNVNQVLNCE